MNQTARPAVQQYTITERSLSVLGTYITAFTFPTAIRLVEGGTLPLEPIVTHVLPLERVSEGLDLLRSGSRDEGRHHARRRAGLSRPVRRGSAAPRPSP